MKGAARANVSCALWVTLCAAVGSTTGCAATRAGGAATQAPVRTTTRASVDPGVAPALLPLLGQVNAALARVGMQPSTESFSGFLPSGNHASFAVRVPAGSCATWVALATTGVQDVDAALYDPQGELLAVDSDPNAHPTLQACAGSSDVALYYVIQLYDGDGSFVIAGFNGPRSALAPAAHVLGSKAAVADVGRPHELQPDDVAGLAEGLRKHGYEALHEPLVFQIAAGEHMHTSLPVEIGKCYTVAAFGDHGIKEVALRVLSDAGDELGASDPGPNAAVQLCAHRAADFSIESAARAGAGKVTLVVYRADIIAAGGEAGLWLGRRAL